MTNKDPSESPKLTPGRWVTIHPLPTPNGPLCDAQCDHRRVDSNRRYIECTALHEEVCGGGICLAWARSMWIGSVAQRLGVYDTPVNVKIGDDDGP